MGEVVSFRGVSRLDLNPDTVLENTKGKVEHLVIIGYDKDGEFYFSSTMANGGDVLWVLELAKIKLYQISGSIE